MSDVAMPKTRAKSKKPPLEQLADIIAADLLGDGDYLHVISKEGKHTGTWLKYDSHLSKAIAARLTEHIELI